MRRYPNKPRRPKAKAAPRLDGAYATLIGLMATLLAARLLISVCGALPPLAEVGDQIIMAPASARPMMTPGFIVAHRIAGPAAPAGAACALDVGRMRAGGGVLSVRAVRPDGVVLGWAGGATAAADCRVPGAATQVIIWRNDYAALLSAQTVKH